MTTTEDPHFTGYSNGRYVKNGYNLGVERSDDAWRSLGLDYCFICCPSGVPPFLDCPHGHALTPYRMQCQQEWYFWRQFVWGTVVALVFFAIGQRGGASLFASISLICWVPFAILYGLTYRKRKEVIGILASVGPYYAEVPNWVWEKHSPWNQPWCKKVL